MSRKQILKAAQSALNTVSVQAARHDPGAWDLANWMCEHIHTKHGGKYSKYSFEGYEPYLVIANTIHEDEVNWFLKGTQVGFSTFFIALALYTPHWRGLDAAYCLPDKVMIKPFMKTRFGDEQVERDRELKGAYNQHESDLYYDCGPNFLYFLGANVLTEQLSRPLEEIFYQSSLNKEPVPPCVRKAGDEWSIICVKCGRKINRARDGRWVAKYPDREIQSYRIPQLIIPGLQLNRLMARWQRSQAKRSKRAKLHSSCLAIPDAGDLQRITKAHLASLKQDFPMRKQSQWSVGGMDMGDICHIVFFEFADEAYRAIWWQTLDGDNVAESAAALIRSMNCAAFVVDGMPLTTEARKFAYEFPGVVHLSYYRGDAMKEGEREHQGKEYSIITQDREQALDDYCDLFQNTDNPNILFPAHVIEDGRRLDFEESDFAAHHIRGSQKEEVKDARSGKIITKYKKHIPNHYFHAGNYAAAAGALLLNERAAFVGVPPVFGDLFTRG